MFLKKGPQDGSSGASVVAAASEDGSTTGYRSLAFTPDYVVESGMDVYLLVEVYAAGGYDVFPRGESVILYERKY